MVTAVGETNPWAIGMEVYAQLPNLVVSAHGESPQALRGDFMVGALSLAIAAKAILTLNTAACVRKALNSIFFTAL